jgi:hypothetical protein
MVSSRRSRLIKRASLAAYTKARSSASVIDIVTVFYLLARQPTSLLNNFIIYAYELFRSNELSVKDVSLTTIKSFLPFSLKANLRVLYR